MSTTKLLLAGAFACATLMAPAAASAAQNATQDGIQNGIAVTQDISAQAKKKPAAAAKPARAARPAGRPAGRPARAGGGGRPAHVGGGGRPAHVGGSGRPAHVGGGGRPAHVGGGGPKPARIGGGTKPAAVGAKPARVGGGNRGGAPRAVTFSGPRTVNAGRIRGVSGGGRFAVHGQNYSAYRSNYRIRRGGGFRTFAALSLLGAIAYGGATYYPYAYISAPQNYCDGLTEDGCQLMWQDVETLEGDVIPQCVAYCPWQQ